MRGHNATMIESIRTKWTGLPAEVCCCKVSMAVVPSSAVRMTALANIPSFSLSINLMRTFKFMGESSCVADKQVEALKLLASQNVQSNSPQSENRAGQRFSLVCRYLYLQRSDGIRNKQSRREQHIVRRRPVDLHLQQLEAMLAHHHHHHYYYCPLVDLLLDQGGDVCFLRWNEMVLAAVGNLVASHRSARARTAATRSRRSIRVLAHQTLQP